MNSVNVSNIAKDMRPELVDGHTQRMTLQIAQFEKSTRKRLDDRIKILPHDWTAHKEEHDTDRAMLGPLKPKTIETPKRLPTVVNKDLSALPNNTKRISVPKDMFRTTTLAKRTV